MLAYYQKLERHDDTDTCPAHSIVPIVKPMYKINRLSYNHYFRMFIPDILLKMIKYMIKLVIVPVQ